MVWWGCRHASKISWGCRHVDKACATYLRYDVIHDIQICCSLGSISARRTSPPVPGAVPCIMEQARYHANRAQRLEQAARRARAWAAELRRAELAGEQAQTPELAAKKAARRTLQRAKAKAKAAAAAAAAEQQEQQEPQQQPQQQQRQQQQEQQQQPQHHPQHVGERSSSSRSQVVGEPTSTGARVVGTPTRTGGGVVGKPTSTGTPGLMAPLSDYVIPVDCSSSSSSNSNCSRSRRSRRRSRSRCRSRSSSTISTSPAPPAPQLPRNAPVWPERVYIYSHDRSCCWEYAERPNLLRIDVREFRDPPTSHDGRHPEVQRRIVAKTYPFLLLCAKVHRHLKAHKGTTCAVAFFCNRGRHRSVACAELLFGVLGGVESMARCYLELNHLSLPWHCLGCRCRNCDDARSTPAVLEAARAVWDRAAAS